MKIEKQCVMCGKYSHVDLTDEEAIGYQKVVDGTITFIQDALPNTDPAVREFLMPRGGGYCSNCQEMLFGRGSERIITT